MNVTLHHSGLGATRDLSSIFISYRNAPGETTLSKWQQAPGAVLECINSRITGDNVRNVLNDVSLGARKPFWGLVVLNLCNNRIGDTGCMAISAAISGYTLLQEIQLGNNRIGDRGAKEIAEALRDNESVTSVGLSFNDITDAGAQPWRILVNQTVLTTLSLVGNTCITEEMAFAIEQILQLPIFLRRESPAATAAAAAGKNPYIAQQKELADASLASPCSPALSYFDAPIGPLPIAAYLRKKEEAIKQAERDLQTVEETWKAAVKQVQENPEDSKPKVEEEAKQRKPKKKKRKGKDKKAGGGGTEDADGGGGGGEPLTLVQLEEVMNEKEKVLKRLEKEMRVERLMQRRHERKIETRKLMAEACTKTRSSPTKQGSALHQVLPVISRDGACGNGEVHKLNLSYQKLGTGDLAGLVAALQSNHHLLRLNLCCNDVGDSGVMAIAGALRVNVLPVMQELLLRNNNIGDPGAACLLSLVHCPSSFAKQATPQLQKASAGRGALQYQKLQTLRTIDLSENYGISKDRLLAVERALASNMQDAYTLPMRIVREIGNRRARKQRLHGARVQRLHEKQARVRRRQRGTKGGGAGDNDDGGGGSDGEVRGAGRGGGGDEDGDEEECEGDDENALHTISLAHCELRDDAFGAGVDGEQHRDAIITARQVERNVRGRIAVAADDGRLFLGEQVAGSGLVVDELACTDWAVQIPPTKQNLFDVFSHRYSQTHQLLRDEDTWNGADSVSEAELLESKQQEEDFDLNPAVDPAFEMVISALLLQHNAVGDGVGREAAQLMALHASWFPPPFRLRHFNTDMGRMMHRDAVPGVYGTLHNSLVALHLAHNEVGDEGAIALAEALSGSWRYHRPPSPQTAGAARGAARGGRSTGTDSRQSASPVSMYFDPPGDAVYEIEPPGGALPAVGIFSLGRVSDPVRKEGRGDEFDALRGMQSNGQGCNTSSTISTIRQGTDGALACRPLPKRVPALRFLFLSHNQIGNEGAKRLAAMARVNSRLEVLDLAANKHVDVELAALFERLMALPHRQRNGHEQWLEVRRRHALEASFGNVLGQSRQQASHLGQVIQTQVQNKVTRRAEKQDLKERLARRRAERRREIELYQ
jgi:hypothetical protein